MPSPIRQDDTSDMPVVELPNGQRYPFPTEAAAELFASNNGGTVLVTDRDARLVTHTLGSVESRRMASGELWTGICTCGEHVERRTSRAVYAWHRRHLPPADEEPPDNLCGQCGVRTTSPGHTACSTCA